MGENPLDGLEDEKIPANDKISEWLKNQADRRRSSNSSHSSDIDPLRRCSMASSISSSQSAEQGIPEKEARKRRLEGTTVVPYDQKYF